MIEETPDTGLTDGALEVTTSGIVGDPAVIEWATAVAQSGMKW